MKIKLESILGITVLFVEKETNSLLVFEKPQSFFLHQLVKAGHRISESVQELLSNHQINGEYKGIIGVVNSVKEKKHLFNFLILCQVPSDPTLTFRTVAQIEEKLPSNSPLGTILQRLKDRSLIQLPRLLINENRNEYKEGRILDLVTFAISVDSQDQVLMVEERTGKWFLPAGHFEEGETIEEASKREVKEETGLDFTTTGISDIVYYYDKYSMLHFILSGDVEGKLKTEADHDSRSAKWFPVLQVQQELSKRDEKYRKPWEIGPFIDHYLENRKNNNFIPLYTFPDADVFEFFNL